MLQDLLGDRQHAPFRHARPALGAGILQHQDRILGHLQILIVKPGRHVVVVGKHHRRAFMGMQGRIGGGLFDHRTVWRQVAAQHREPAFNRERVGAPVDDIGVVDVGARKILTQGFAVNRHAVEMQQILQLSQQAAHAAGVEEVLHQIFPRGPDIRQPRRLSGDPVEAFEIKFDAEASGHGDQVHDGIG